MEMNSQESEENTPAPDTNDGASGDVLSQENGEEVVESDVGITAEQVPDDPDEAIAWLERLAARQGARAEELPTLKPSVVNAGVGQGSLEETDLAEVEAGEIPEDPDEAMAWLEMLAAKEIANSDHVEAGPDIYAGETVLGADDEAGVEAGAEVDASTSPLTTDLVDALEASLPNDIDQALGWLEELAVQPQSADEPVSPANLSGPTEEPPTPAEAQTVDEELAGAEFLFAESEGMDESEIAAPVVEVLPQDETDDAMAWLEQLAARQGASIEALTSVDNVSEELAPDEDLAAETLETDVSIADEATEIGVRTESGIGEVADVVEDEVEQAEDSVELEYLEELAEPDTEPPSSGDLDESIPGTGLVEQDAYEQRIVSQGQVSAESPEPDELELAPYDEALAGDLAWLDTLGAVDAEGWLEAEAAVDVDESAPELADIRDEFLASEHELPEFEEFRLFEALPEGPDAESLIEARQEMKQGEYSESLAKYSVLVDKGEHLPYLIEDLEAIREQKGPEPVLQRVLGDAYARNGQLRKALESYREALANL